MRWETAKRAGPFQATHRCLHCGGGEHAGGRASRAELENENGRLVYDVEVADNTKTTDVKVDAADGSVVSAQADRADEQSKNGLEERDDD